MSVAVKAPSAVSPTHGGAGRRLLAVVLAAGEGTRMRSTLPKVLHKVAGRSMLGHVLESLKALGAARIAVVVGPGRADVAAEAGRLAPGAAVHVQEERRGTAHALLAARATLAEGYDDILMVYADTPLLEAPTLAGLVGTIAGGAAVSVLGFEAADPAGYGRLVTEGPALLAIREDKDASAAERLIRLCNGGPMALDGRHALSILDAIDDNNAKREFYVTDAVEIARRRGFGVGFRVAPEDELRGVNTRGQLAEAEAVFQSRARARAMAEGVTLVDPSSVFLAADTVLGRDVTIEPHVVFGPGVKVADEVTIRAFCHIEGAAIGKGAVIGPFARLRPKTVIGDEVHIGNFVEVNRSTLAREVQANHLAYIGDAEVGEGSNIGAGTITCNFDGADKHATVIGRDVFVGSNATLVAPLRLGDKVLVAAGSTVTKDVEAGAMVFGRARQLPFAGKGLERIEANKVKRAERKRREKEKG